MARVAGGTGRAFVVGAFVAVLAVLAGPALAADPPAPYLDIVEIEGVIDAPTADYLIDRIDAAQDEAHALVIQLDTPGGLDIAMRDIIGEIMQSEIPVIVWVAPQGSRAASAGTFIAYAAHLTYMAAATELGAATPVNLSGESLPPGVEEKATNDAVAFIT
ncbi:MAG: nodulation protein NfeD, partial [Actinomycetota bacterium]|nr:nodulation protein NfeD [Actinomycetota bacterium]